MGWARRGWVAAQVRALAAHPEVTLLTRTTAFGWYPGPLVGLAQRITDHLPRPGPGFAAGAFVADPSRSQVDRWPPARFERPMLFPDNDRPGVMLAGAARDSTRIAYRRETAG